MKTEMQKVEATQQQAKKDARHPLSRYRQYDMYQCRVYMREMEVRVFESKSLFACHEAAKEWMKLIEEPAEYFWLEQITDYFKLGQKPEIQFIDYLGSDDPSNEESWESVRWNFPMVGLEREITFKDMEKDLKLEGEEAETEQEVLKENKARWNHCNTCH